MCFCVWHTLQLEKIYSCTDRPTGPRGTLAVDWIWKYSRHMTAVLYSSLSCQLFMAKFTLTSAQVQHLYLFVSLVHIILLY